MVPVSFSMPMARKTTPRRTLRVQVRIWRGLLADWDAMKRPPAKWRISDRLRLAGARSGFVATRSGRAGINTFPGPQKRGTWATRQQIALTGLPTAAELEDLPLSVTVPSPPTWTIGGANGTNVGGYNPSTASASVAETTLTGPTLTTYWVYPGTFQVTYTSCIESQTASPALYECPTATATFEVSGPNGPNATGTMTFSPFSPSVSIADLDSCTDSNGVFWRAGPYLAYAQNYSGTPCPGQGFMETFGISFNSPTGYQNTSGGNFVLVQLIGSDVVTGGCCTQPAGLDTKYPYGLPPSNDNPITYLPPTITNASRTFTANMFLMWQSTTTGSIPVPVGYQNWGFSGTAICKANCGSASNWTATNTPGTTPGPVGNFVTSDPSQTQTNDKNNVLVDGYPTWAGPPSY